MTNRETCSPKDARFAKVGLGGVSEIARKSKRTREATYRMLSKSGNLELCSLTAILGAAGLRLSVEPIGNQPAASHACLASLNRKNHSLVIRDSH